MTKLDASAALIALGLPPRLLPMELAASYVGLSAATFLKAVRDGHYPPAIVDGKRKRWDIRALDAAVDRRSGIDSFLPGPQCDEMMRVIDAAS